MKKKNERNDLPLYIEHSTKVVKFNGSRLIIVRSPLEYKKMIFVSTSYRGLINAGDESYVFSITLF